MSHNVGDQGAGAVAPDETYADENYDYGAYGEAGYDDGSGMIDPNTTNNLPLAGADGNKVDELLDQHLHEYRDDEGKKQWSCNICEFTRRYCSDVERHVKQKHKDLYIPCTNENIDGY